jgi:hypothetical protein
LSNPGDGRLPSGPARGNPDGDAQAGQRSRHLNDLRGGHAEYLATDTGNGLSARHRSLARGRVPGDGLGRYTARQQAGVY